MRSVRLLLALPLLLLVVSTADAAPKPKEEKLPVIVETGISQFDPTFMEAKGIHETITTQDTALKDAKKGVNKAAGVAEDAPLDTGLAAIKATAAGKITLDNSGATPRVKAADGSGEDVKNAAMAINKLMDAGEATLGVAKDLEPKAKSLADTASAFPGQVKDLDPGAVLKAGTKITNDVKATASTPERVSRLARSAEEVFTAIKGAFAE